MNHVGWMHDFYDLLGGLAGVILAVAAAMKAWASVREVGLRATAMKGLRAIRLRRRRVGD